MHDSIDELVTFEQFSELLRSIEASPFFLGNADELVAVGTALTGGPPHRSQRAAAYPPVDDEQYIIDPPDDDWTG